MDTDGRWTLKRGRKRPPTASERTQTELAVPVVGYNNHLGIDRRHGFIRTFVVTDASPHDGQQLGKLLDLDNTASAVWAETAYRSAANVACWRTAGWSRSSSGRSRGASRCRRAWPVATPVGPGPGRD